MQKGYAGNLICWKIEELSEQGSPQDDGQFFPHVSLRLLQKQYNVVFPIPK